MVQRTTQRGGTPHQQSWSATPVWQPSATDMYLDAWPSSDAVVLTPPDPEYLVAAGILAAAQGTSGLPGVGVRPAAVLIASPIGETAGFIRKWASLPHRPRLWIMALDAHACQELGGTQGNAMQQMVTHLNALGASILVTPEAHAANPVEWVVSLLRKDPGVCANRHWRHLAQSAPRRLLAVRRAVAHHAARDGRMDGERRYSYSQALATICGFTVNQVRTIREAWNAGGLAWDLIARDLQWKNNRWHSAFIQALTWIDGPPDDGAWSLLVIGLSATSNRLRHEAQQAVRVLADGGTVILIPHDPMEARNLGDIIAHRAEGHDLLTANPQRELPEWRPRFKTGANVYLASIEDEAAAYALAARNPRVTVVDVPPLDERSMDIPHIALDMLWRLHRTERRPGAPRAGVDLPEQLAWMSARDWLGGTGGLQRWLASQLRRDPGGDWLHGKADVPPHPGLHGTCCLGHQITLETASAHIVRWALGAHSQQKSALKRLGVGTCRLPACATAANGQPRRLIRDGAAWKDRWFIPA